MAHTFAAKVIVLEISGRTQARPCRFSGRRIQSSQKALGHLGSSSAQSSANSNQPRPGKKSVRYSSFRACWSLPSAPFAIVISGRHTPEEGRPSAMGKWPESTFEEVWSHLQIILYHHGCWELELVKDLAQCPAVNRAIL